MAAKSAPPVPPLASIIKGSSMHTNRIIPLPPENPGPGHSSIDSLCAAALAVSAQDGSSFSVPTGGSLIGMGMSSDTMLLSGHYNYKEYKDKYDMNVFVPNSSAVSSTIKNTGPMLLPESQLAAAMAAERYSGGGSGAEQFSVFMRSIPSIKSIPSLTLGSNITGAINPNGGSNGFNGSANMDTSSGMRREA